MLCPVGPQGCKEEEKEQNEKNRDEGGWEGGLGVLPVSMADHLGQLGHKKANSCSSKC